MTFFCFSHEKAKIENIQNIHPHQGGKFFFAFLDELGHFFSTLTASLMRNRKYNYYGLKQSTNRPMYHHHSTISLCQLLSPDSADCFVFWVWQLYGGRRELIMEMVQRPTPLSSPLLSSPEQTVCPDIGYQATQYIYWGGRGSRHLMGKIDLERLSIGS